MTDIPPTFPPVNRCIYCGAGPAEGQLEDEHIVPYAMGGTSILPKSSCRKCAAVTGRVEGLVLRGGLRGLKERVGLSSRTKKRPTKLPLFCVNGEEDRKVDVEIDDYPAIVILPQFVGPLIAEFPSTLSSPLPPWCFSPQLDVEKLRDKYKIRSFASNSMDTFSFARMLAKIALSYAVAHHGTDSLITFLPDIILNNRGGSFLSVIGSIQSEFVPVEGDITHHLQLLIEPAGGQRYVTCHIRLFSNLGAPAYRVVVGQLRSDFNPLTMPSSVRLEAASADPFVRMVISTEPDPGPNFMPFNPNAIGIISRAKES